MLPDVDAEQRRLTIEIGESWLAVLTTRAPIRRVTSHAQPEPNWPDAGFLELLLERVEAAERLVDRRARSPSGSRRRPGS